MYIERKLFKRVKWLMFWVMITQIAAYFIVNTVYSFFAAPPDPYFGVLLVTVLTFVPTLFVFFMSDGMESERPVKETLKLNGFPVQLAVLVILMAVFGQFIMVLLNLPANWLFPVADSYPPAQTLSGFALGVICIALVPAVFEELLMRGIVFNALNTQDTFVAVLYSSVMFAVLHADFHNTLGFLFMGFILAVILLRTRSLYAAILYHFVNNMVSLTLEPFISQFYGQRGFVLEIFGLSILLFAACLFVFVKLSKATRRSVSPNKWRSFRLSLISLPSLLCIAAAVVIQYLAIIQK